MFSNGDDVSSSDDMASEKSFGFYLKPLSQGSNDGAADCVAEPAAPVASPIKGEMLVFDEDSMERGSAQLGSALDPIDVQTIDVDQSVRRSSRRRIPNSKYTDDYISPTISPVLSRVVSPKRSHSPAANSLTDLKSVTPSRTRKKRVKCSPNSSPDPRQFISRAREVPSVIGNMQLTWPRYGIRNAIYEGRIYSVTNTCPLDIGLFILYHAYKAGTAEFRERFERDDLHSYATIRRTFQMVESDGWTTARLYWLVKHGLLKKKNEDHLYDIENTLTEIVFRFVQPMQKYLVTSTCSCSACPKQIRQTTSSDIALT